MTNIIRVAVDLDEVESLEEHGSLERGVYSIDNDGVFHMYHSMKNYIVNFSPLCEICEDTDIDCTCYNKEIKEIEQ